MNIFIVEDEAINALYLKNFLTFLGHNIVAVAKSGDEAVNYALSHDAIDLILMDILLLDETDGIEAIKTIHKTKYIPVIYITASTDERTLNRAKETKMLDFITKPFNIEQLIKVIQSIKK